MFYGDAINFELATRWWPVLTDANDEIIAVHLAVKAGSYLVTHNVRHLEPAGRFRSFRRHIRANFCEN